MLRPLMSGFIYAVTPVTAPLSLITPYHVLSSPIISYHPLKKLGLPITASPSASLFVSIT